MQVNVTFGQGMRQGDRSTDPGAVPGPTKVRQPLGNKADPRVGPFPAVSSFLWLLRKRTGSGTIELR